MLELRSRSRDRRDGGDAGLTLVEVMVAMSIFAVMATITAGLSINTLSTVKNNRQRVTAGNLAQTQIEQARSLRTLDIPDGATPATTAVVGGTTYTVRQTVDEVASDSSTSICQGSGNNIGYKLVTVIVTWPNMGSTKPVRADTLKALGVGADGLDSSKGVLALAALDANGNPQQGVSVTLTPGGLSRTTGSDGCAVYTGLAPGSYVAAISQPSYVTVDGLPTFTSASLGVTASSITRATASYDLGGTLNVGLTAPTGYTAPAKLAVTLSSTRFTPNQNRIFLDCSAVASSPVGCVSGTPRSQTTMFPGQYGAWAGTCADAAPSPAPNLVTITGGSTTTTSVALGGVTVNVTNASGVPLTGKTLYAYHASDSQCGTPEVYVINTGGASTAKAALPLGTWSFTLTPDASGAPSGGWPTASITAGGAAGPVTVKGS